MSVYDGIIDNYLVWIQILKIQFRYANISHLPFFYGKETWASHFSPIIHTCLGVIILLAEHNWCDHPQIRVEGSKMKGLKTETTAKTIRNLASNATRKVVSERRI